KPAASGANCQKPPLTCNSVRSGKLKALTTKSASPISSRAAAEANVRIVTMRLLVRRVTTYRPPLKSAASRTQRATCRVPVTGLRPPDARACLGLSLGYTQPGLERAHRSGERRGLPHRRDGGTCQGGRAGLPTVAWTIPAARHGDEGATVAPRRSAGRSDSGDRLWERHRLGIPGSGGAHGRGNRFAPGRPKQPLHRDGRATAAPGTARHWKLPPHGCVGRPAPLPRRKLRPR